MERGLFGLGAHTVLWLGLLLLTAPSLSAAGTTTIKYRVTGGSVSGGDLRNAPITGGSYTIAHTAFSSFRLVTGPAELLSLSFAVPPAFTIDGSFRDSFQLGLTAAVLGNGTQQGRFLNTAIAALSGTINVHCYGFYYCGVYGLQPSVARDFGLYVTVGVGGVDIRGPVGSARGSFTIPNLPDLGFGIASITGVEVERTFVVEPGGRWVAAVAFGVSWLLTQRRFSALRQPDGTLRTDQTPSCETSSSSLLYRRIPS